MQSASAKSSILIVDDDVIAREVIAAHIRQAGMDVIEADSARKGLALAKCQSFDLVVLDVNLPDGSGFSLAPLIQAERDAPIIYITTRGAAEDRIRGLSNGGDDYLVKPVDLRELVARILVVLRRRRRQGAYEGGSVVTFRGWMLDFIRRELTNADGQLIALTRAEFDLFAALYQNGPIPLHRDYLLEVIASSETLTKARTIDVMISRIRRKLAVGSRSGPLIVTKAGEGYLLMPHGR